jgi:hypothetical protein
MGRTEDARFGALLRPMLDDPAPGVRPNAIRALGALRRAAECTEWLRVTAECATAEENRFTLRLRVTDGAAVPVTSLPGTAFVCWNGDELLTAYDVSVDTLRPGHYLLEASDAVPRVQAFRRACSAAPQRGAH